MAIADNLVRDVSADTLPTLIDNRPGNRMLEALGRLMQESKSLDVATGYFEIGALVALDGDWQSLQKMRLLMGDELTRKTRDAILASIKTANGIEAAQITDDWRTLTGLKAVIGALKDGFIEARVYTRAKFHAKAYHFYTGGIANHGIVGSSNFTRPGLTQNVELNVLISDKTHLKELANWYADAWKEAEDISTAIVDIIEPYVAEYTPFAVYIQAMREYFRDRASDKSAWEDTESNIYPLLARYQKDAYHDLMAFSNAFGGALLCDGVGLGKTFVGLMLIERARLDNQKVLIIAPSSAIPSVWKRNLSRFFPDDFGDYTDDIRVIPMTDFGRQGGMTEAKLNQLRKRYGTIIIDEAHHFRMPHRNRSKRMKKLVAGKQLFLLTATPINNTVLDLYNLINLFAQDDQKRFQKIGVPHLRNWFGAQMSEKDQEQPTLDLMGNATYREFLKHILVQRSRAYVKQLDILENDKVKFPVRARPIVVNYSLEGVYGTELPRLLKTFDTKGGLLKLVIYETEKYKKQEDKDASVLQEQSNVAGLIRTMLLKRLESSQVAFQSTIEDLLFKHLLILREINALKYEAWIADNASVHAQVLANRQERFDYEDEEEDELPATTYENKKLREIGEDLKQFGDKEAQWIANLEEDARLLGDVLKSLYVITRPETDAKLRAFIEIIRSHPGLREKKFVVFSEFKDTARYLEVELKKAFPHDNIVEVDSGRGVSNREEIIRRFAPYYNCETEAELEKALSNPIRILISTDVLSEGLNLQDANQIVNYDLHWNPVRLMQRIGRVDRRMDPAKPVDYDEVQVFNFLPPDQLEKILHLFQRVSGKLVAINRTLGIEAPVLTAEDDFKAMDFYQNLGNSSMSAAERLRLEAHRLEAENPSLWKASEGFPNRIYSGRESKGQAMFLAYRVATGTNDHGEVLFDVRWFLVDRATGNVSENLEEIHSRIKCIDATARTCAMPESERDRLRKLVESKNLAVTRLNAQIPATIKDELICWMEL